ncbi:hypothetical protein [Sphingobium sp. YR768]|uniref:hypothetical protein n=1 Tax=Sphingobium sp. YR768 TaxID=1884365 RepID=UPI0008C175EB|nr:hypothetical protein [Sphingobium sp. YR768]SEQ47526.1 hypothetical protein SAMN05518866_10152 [Sphingobium sp. YR768]
MHEVATSRRAVMCAFALTPLYAIPAVKAAPTDAINAPAISMTKVDRTAWDAALEQYTAARYAEDTFDRHTWTPAYEREKSGKSKIPDRVSEKMDRLTDVRCDAEDRLIATASPTLSAAIWKIEYARNRWADFVDWPDDWWISVMTDLRRFAGEAVA